MNRIREMREAAGLSRRELGDALGVTQHTIRRYEIGEMGVTLDLLRRIAVVLQCEPADLVIGGVGSLENDVIAEPSPVPELRSVLASREIGLYRVATDVLAEAGLRIGAIITVDQSAAAIAARRAGDALIVRLPQPDILLLRQYLPPALLTTNRFGPDNSSLKLDDRTLRMSIVGVVARSGQE